MAKTKKAAAVRKGTPASRKVATKAKSTRKATATKSKPAARAAAPKPAAPVKLNDRQREFLKKIKESGESGFEVAHKNDERTLDALSARKLVKHGAKNKESGKHRYLLTKAAEKHLPAAPAAVPAPVVVPAPAAAPAPVPAPEFVAAADAPPAP
jgi:hypothetical protein